MLKNSVIENNIIEFQNIVSNSKYNLNTKIDMNGSTILHFAVLKERENFVELLCYNSQNLNICDRDHVKYNFMSI